MKIKLKEGQIISLPLADNSIGIGLIARIEGSLMLAYFLKDFYVEIPSIDKLNFKKENVILISLVSTLGLKNGTWRMLGELSDWDREYWNVPVFYRKDTLSDIYYKVSYSDKLERLGQKIVDDDAEELQRKFPKDGIAGYGALEEILSMLLGK